MILGYYNAQNSFNKYLAIKNLSISPTYSNVSLKLIGKTKYKNMFQYLLKLEGKINITDNLIFKDPGFIFLDSRNIKNRILANIEISKMDNTDIFDYFYSQGVYFKITKLEILQDLPNKNTFFENIAQRIGQSFDFYLSYPYNEFMKSLMLNQRDNFPKYLRDIFKDTNTYHIFAISGSHIVIINVILINLLMIIGLRKNLSITLTLITVSLYLLIINFPIPALRSVVFNFCAVLSLFISKRLDLRKLILYISFVFLLIKPDLIRFDLSFILSFIASLSIVIFSEPMFFVFYEKLKLLKLKILLDPLISSISATLLMVPLNFYFWGKFNYLSFVINGIVLLIITLVVFLGIFAIITFWLKPAILILSFLIEKTSQLTINLVTFLDKPQVFKAFFKPNMLFFFIYYSSIIFLIFLWSIYRKNNLIPISKMKKQKRPSLI